MRLSASPEFSIRATPPWLNGISGFCTMTIQQDADEHDAQFLQQQMLFNNIIQAEYNDRIGTAKCLRSSRRLDQYPKARILYLYTANSEYPFHDIRGRP